MKTITELLEGYDKKKNVPEVMAHGSIVELEKFADRESNILHTSITDYHDKLETFLNKLGYTMGDLGDEGWDKEGEEDFMVFQYSDPEREMKNVYLSLEWREVNHVASTTGGAHLSCKVSLTINTVDPMEFDDLINAKEVYIDDTPGYRDDTTDELNESINPAFIKKVEGMSDSQLKSALKQYRDKDEDKYNAVVDEFEQRGLKEESDCCDKDDEELEEVSKKTLGSYIKKSASRHRDNGKDFVHNINSKRDGSQNDVAREKEKREIRRKARNRSKGIERATDRLMKENFMSIEEDGSLKFMIEGKELDVPSEGADDFIQEMVDTFLNTKKD